MYITKSDLFSFVSPLMVALHEKGILDISETALAYEDALARRRLEMGQSAPETAFLEETVRGLHYLAGLLKQQNPPT